MPPTLQESPVVETGGFDDGVIGELVGAVIHGLATLIQRTVRHLVTICQQAGTVTINTIDRPFEIMFNPPTNVRECVT